MNGFGDLLGGIFGLSCMGIVTFIFIAAPIVMIFVLLKLVNKTKEEEAAAKIELQQIVSGLPSDKQAAFFLHYTSQAKNPTTAVVLAVLLGGIGAHKFYLGEMGLGIIYLVFSWTSIPMILGIIEGFTISRTVHKKNRQTAREVSALLGGDVAALFM